MNRVKHRGWSLLSLLVAGGCVSRGQYDRVLAEYHGENQLRRQLEQEMDRRNAEISGLSAQLSSKDSQITVAEEARVVSESRVAQLEQALKDAQKQMASIEGVDVFRTADGLMYRMENQLLFDSGSTAIKESGKQVLLNIGRQITTKGYSEIRIDGHTDTDPVRVTKEQYPLGNHELASRRALAVYDVLVNGGKVDSKMVTLAAFGPNRPAVEGSNDAAKSKNRRVEVFVKVPEK